MDEHGMFQALASTQLSTYDHLCSHGNACKDQNAKQKRYGSMSSMVYLYWIQSCLLLEYLPTSTNNTRNRLPPGSSP
jgi:hypothetical protein